MTIHTIILAIVIATLIGAVFHLLRGGSIHRLGLHLLAANLSFFLGHWLSQLINWELLRVGAINLFPALLAALIGLILTATLAGEELENNGKAKSRRERRK